MLFGTPSRLSPPVYGVMVCRSVGVMVCRSVTFLHIPFSGLATPVQCVSARSPPLKAEAQPGVCNDTPSM